MLKYFLILIALSLTHFSIVHASESTSISSYSQSTSSKSTVGNADWSLNMGTGHFDLAPTYSYTDSGKFISLELQRRFFSNVFIGASYTNYAITRSANTKDSYFDLNPRNVEALGLSLETHPIELNLPLSTQFFAAVNGGITQALQSAEGIGSFYVSLGMGINYNDQIGIRTDIRADQYDKSYNTLSLVGYY